MLAGRRVLKTLYIYGMKRRTIYLVLIKILKSTPSINKKPQQMLRFFVSKRVWCRRQQEGAVGSPHNYSISTINANTTKHCKRDLSSFDP